MLVNSFSLIFFSPKKVPFDHRSAMEDESKLPKFISYQAPSQVCPFSFQEGEKRPETVTSASFPGIPL